MPQKDFLFELFTEELPPKNLEKLSQSLQSLIVKKLHDVQLGYESIQSFATPRRLALSISKLDAYQPEHIIERRGPALEAAFDEQSNPSAACLGFAKSCGVSVDHLEQVTTTKGSWIYFKQKQKGKTIFDLMPQIFQEALSQLPIEKLMRWSDSAIEFVRPVHRVIMLFGSDVIPATILGCKTSNETLGHRFLSGQKFKIKKPSDYELTLEQHFVIASFEKRKNLIQQQLESLAKQKKAYPIIPAELLNEVTALVEWPVAITGQFSKEFLALPKEVIVASVQKHQKSFLLENKEKFLLPFFITISNIETLHQDQIIQGNERVMNARLCDAQFFYKTDLTQQLELKTIQLESIIFQEKLGNLLEKTKRVTELSQVIAKDIGANIQQSERAAFLSKADLVSEMVNEFPELQGIMGYYYACDQQELGNVSVAIREHYMPLHAYSDLPRTLEGMAVALADRIDTLVGIFGIGKKPTGEKDPFGLRRAALGIIRIIIDQQLDVNLYSFLKFSQSQYQKMSNILDVSQEVFEFILERLKYWIIEQQKFSINLFLAVQAIGSNNLLDSFNRMKALIEFQKWPEAQNLIAAHKRVNNLLSKEMIFQKEIQRNLLIEAEEKSLVAAIEKKRNITQKWVASKEYLKILKELSTFRPLVDSFFDHVMVMVDEETLRHNRLAILWNLKALFLQVADIGLLSAIPELNEI